MAATGVRRAAASALVVIAAAACSDLDVVTASYGTLAEARQAGEIERGWIPQGLPPGAFELRSAHNADTNARWGLFSFPPAESSHLKALLAGPEFPLQGQQCNPPRRIEWWPIQLRGSLDAERIAATGLKAYQTADETLVFVVNWNQGRAYYWSVK
jgi:hypothetical protein